MMNKEIKAVKPDIDGVINGLLPDNSTGQITPNIIREVLHTMSLMMQNEHASLFGGGTIEKDGTVTHYKTAQCTPFFDAWTDPETGTMAITEKHDVLVIDASVKFEVTGGDTFKVGYAIGSEKNLEYYAMMSNTSTNTQFRVVINNPPVDKEVSLYILPIKDGVLPSLFKLNSIDMHMYGIKVGKNA